MQITILLPSEAEATIIARSETGAIVKLKSLIIEPRFWRPSSIPSVLFFESCAGGVDEGKQNGQILQRGAIQISGTTGKLSIVDRTTAQKSKVELKLESGESPDDEEATLEESEEEEVEEDADESPTHSRRKK